MTDDVHQVRYRWTEESLLGERGMGPAESSLSREELAVWDARMRDHVWATGAQPGYTFLRTDGRGALIRKVTTEAGGRPGSSAHVLIGRPLVAGMAVGLTTWPGWDAPELVPLPWAELSPVAHDGMQDVRRRSRALPPDRLATLVAHLLDASGEPFSVLAEPDPVAVVLAFGDLVGRPATFATDEADDNGAGMPEVVFLREAPFSTTVAARRRLTAEVAPADAELHTFAIAMVEAYRTLGREGLNRIRVTVPPADVAGARAWARRAQFRPGVLADLTRLHLLAPETLDDLVADPATVTATAGTAAAGDLAYALGQALPDALLTCLIPVALGRAVPPTGEHLVLEALAKHAPIDPALLTPHLPVDVDRLAYVTGKLLSDEDRLAMLTAKVDVLSTEDLVSWIGERAADDPAAAWAGFLQMCRRAPQLTEQEVASLVAGQLLTGSLGAVLGSAAEVANAARALLLALPPGTHDLGTLAPLIERGGAAVLHAVESAVADPAVREAVQRRIRSTFYQAEGLPEPAPPPAPAGSRWSRALQRRRPVDDRNDP